MKVFQISLKVFLIENIEVKDSLCKIAAFIDSGLSTDPQLLQLHEKNMYKNYCFNNMFPLELKEKIYRKGNIYTIVIRTIDAKLAKFFNDNLVNHHNSSMKGLTSEIKVIPKRYIEKLYCLTPVVLKTDSGYWRNSLTLDSFEERLHINLIKKYNAVMGNKIDENFKLYTSIEFKNKKPIAMNYKNISILGDKISINISDDKRAQELAYLSLGVGLLESNARGAGFVNYKFL